MTTDSGGGGDPPDKPDRPDPFAPLPLTKLPPVRRRTSFSPGDESPSEAPEPASPPPPAADVSEGSTTEAVPAPAPEAASAPIAAAPDLMATVEPDPLVPSSTSEDELRAAIGAAPRPERSRKREKLRRSEAFDDEDDGPGAPRSRAGLMVAITTLVVGAGVAAVVLLGKANGAHYQITCAADRVLVERGRVFPPWGTAPMRGAEWAALKIPPEAECHPRQTEDQAQLAGWYKKVLVDQASTLLTGREITKVDEAEAQLKQALLVARSLPTDDDRINARKDIERLLGDVVYWRASAKLRAAADELKDAAKQFDAAAAQRPRHVSDASAWATHVRSLVEQLRAGPGGTSHAVFPPVPPVEGPSAPPGVPLPVEPGEGSGSGSAGSASEPPIPDAGVPSGGVLL